MRLSGDDLMKEILVTGLTETGIGLIIEGLIEGKGSQLKAAAHLGISPQHLSDIVSGKRGISDAVAQKLGYERRFVFVETK